MKPIEFSKTLLAWYQENGRNLPWREDADPYKIWVSEIILQQTRVVQGLSYYLRFMDRFPDVQVLAAADEAEVMKYWEGLGYYSRARNLHHAARQIVARGTFPNTFEEIRKLKGIGDYTAAAIASFAFGLPHAVVDGNVYRVLSRYLGVDEPIDTTLGKKLFSKKAHELFDAFHAADYNQAIMDFGALQCVPKNPDCGICPFLHTCVAYKEGRVEDFPVKQGKQTVRSRYFTFIYIEFDGRVAMWRRSSGDIWAGLCQPFLLEWEGSLPGEEALLTRLSALLGYSVDTLKTLKNPVRQRLSHQLLHASFYVLSLAESPDPACLPDGAFWVSREQVGQLAFPKMLINRWP